MTIASSKNTPRVAYTATANQQAFTIPFEFFHVNDIKVYNGTTLLTYDANADAVTEYSITGTASDSDEAYEYGAGGTVNIGATGISAGAIITIIRDITIERASDFSSTGTFVMASLNTDLDKVWAKLADLDQQSDRSIKLADTDSIAATMTLPAKATRASKVLTFDSDGEPDTSYTAVDVTTVAGIASDVTTVSGISANVTTVAGKATEIGRLGTADAVADMAILGTADVVADMNTLATSDIISDLNTLATSDIVTDMNLLATSANVTNMATLGASGVVSNIATVSGSISNVNTVASNISGVNSFADRYRVASSDPSSSLDAGDLVFNTSANQLKYYSGSAWAVVANTDTNVSISANDSSSGLLGAKLTATGSTGVTLTETNDGSAETLNVTLASVPNSSLANSAITINGSATSLGGSVTVGETKPTISSISPSTIPNTATAVTITGTNFVTVPQVEAINPSTGIWYVADSVSFTSATTIVATFTLAVDATYKLRVENPDGLSVLSSSALLTVSDAPTWSTASGSLGEVEAGASVSLDVDASSDSTVAFSETTTVLTSNANTPAATMNLTLNSSTGAITGTAPSPTSETTYNFTLRATDAESQTADRAFSIKVTVAMNNSGQFN